MEEEYLNFFVLVLIIAFFFTAGYRIRHNPEKQIERIVKIIKNNNTYPLFSISSKHHLKPEDLINKEYRNSESN